MSAPRTNAKIGEALALALALASALSLLALSLTRRLNFDEPLALRAGWLALEGIDARPAFVMPWTLWLGALGHLLADPGAVILAGRLSALLLVGGAFGLAARAAGLGRLGVALAVILCVGQASFIVHGLEFRYDAAILGGLLLGLAALLRASPRADLALGAVAGWLALHHLKGAFFAAALLIIAGAARGRGLSLRRVGLGLGLAALTWAGLLSALGLWGAWGRSLDEFIGLAGSGRSDPVEALLWVLRRDLGWWLLVLAGLLTLALRRPRPLDERILLALGLVAAGFPLLHPRPWSYMLALPAPFFALLLARVGEGLPAGRARWAALGVVGIAGIVQDYQGGAIWTQLRRGLRADGQEAVACMRVARAELDPGLEVFDPSGLLWFARPCVPDWYLDTLFAQGLADGSWMPELSAGLPTQCAVVVQTYRLNMLSDELRAALAAERVAVGPLWLLPDEPRLDGLRARPELERLSLESYK